MNEEIKYIGTFDEEEKSKKSSKKNSSKDSKQVKFKTNKYNKKVEKFIASTKTKLLNKKVIVAIICVLLIFIFKPITFLRAKLDEKREYYSQFETNSFSGKGIIDSIMYMSGVEYYKNCKDTMVYPADGSIIYQYDLAHKGIDITCDEYPGNIYAVANGYVVSTGYSEKYGNEILIQHNINGIDIYTYYANLSVINVSQGQHVYQNEVIGLEGGDPSKKSQIMDSQGHHLHFEVRKSKDKNSGLNPLIFIEQ